MIEFAFVLIISRLNAPDKNASIAKTKTRITKDVSRTTTLLVVNGGNSITTTREPESNEGSEDEQNTINTKKSYKNTDIIDFLALFIFLFSYALFNCFYMLCYL